MCMYVCQRSTEQTAIAIKGLYNHWRCGVLPSCATPEISSNKNKKSEIMVYEFNYYLYTIFIALYLQY